MKSGVSTSPCSVLKRAARAREPLAVAITWKARRDMSVACPISQSAARAEEPFDNRRGRAYTAPDAQQDQAEAEATAKDSASSRCAQAQGAPEAGEPVRTQAREGAPVKPSAPPRPVER